MAKDEARTKRLLENAKKSSVVTLTDPDSAKIVYDFTEYRKLKHQCEALEKELREKVEELLDTHQAGAISTPAGMIVAIPRSRTQIDKRKLTEEERARAETTISYVELTDKPAIPTAVVGSK